MDSKATDHFRGETLMTGQSLDNRANNNATSGHPGGRTSTAHKYQNRISGRPAVLGGQYTGQVPKESHFGVAHPGFRDAEDDGVDDDDQDEVDLYAFNQRQAHDAAQRHMGLPAEDDYSNLKNFLNQIRGKNQMLLSKESCPPSQNWDKTADQPEALQSQSMSKQKKFKSIHSRQRNKQYGADSHFRFNSDYNLSPATNNQQ